MSWDAQINGPLSLCDIFDAAAIWGKDPINCWTTASVKLPLTADDIKVLLGDTSKFKLEGPRLMGTKFFMVSDGLDNDDILCMSLKAVNVPEPYFIVFGFFKTGVYVAKAISREATTAVPHIFKAVKHLRDAGY